MDAIWDGLRVVLNMILDMIQYLVIGSVLVSWFNADPNQPIVRMIHQTTEPMYRPLRRLTSRIPGPLDWAPVLILMIVVFLQRVLFHYR